MSDFGLNTLWTRYKNNLLFQFALGIVILIFLVFLMDQVVMPWYTNHGNETELPDVVDKPLEEARRLLEQKGFHVIVADSVFDEHFAVGTVVEQMPLPFSTVKVGRNVYLKVSIGEKPVFMPNLFSLSPRDAELRLRSYGLELETIMYAYNDLYPEGAVIAQSYPQGQKVRKGAKISLTVSLGEMPSRKTIPQLVGKSLSAAQKQLELLGVKRISVSWEKNTNMLPETILKQSLDAGSEITEHTEIELLVSKMSEPNEE